MKKLLLIISCCLFTNFLSAQGQLSQAYHHNELSLAFTSGYSTIDIKIPEANKICGEPQLGYGLNLLYLKNITRYFSIQTGVLYNSIFNIVHTSDRSIYRIHIDHLQMPVLCRLNTDKCSRINYSVFAGPQISFNPASSTTVLKSPQNMILTSARRKGAVLSISRTEFCVAYGGGADISFSNAGNFMLNLGFIGSFGLTDLSGPVAENEINILPENSTMKTFGGFTGFTIAF